LNPNILGSLLNSQKKNSLQRKRLKLQKNKKIGCFEISFQGLKAKLGAKAQLLHQVFSALPKFFFKDSKD
jgi:hypothetical protein